MNREVIAVDFDGTIFNRETGVLFVGAVEFLRTLNTQYDLVIFSARCSQLSGRSFIMDVLRKHQLVGIITEVTDRKKFDFKLIIDDRARYCNGNQHYGEILDSLRL